MNDFGSVVVPAMKGEDGFVFLSKTAKGRLYRKQILHMGHSFVHPNAKTQKIEVTPELAQSLVDNFEAEYCDIVQVPIVDGANKHVEDPTRNVGQVVDLEVDESGVYAIIDDRRSDAQIKEQGELGKTLLGASAMMHLDYEDSTTGNHVGPTLLHVGITNRPYITKLSDFEEIIAASADSLGVSEPVVLSPATEEPEEQMDLDEMLAALKADHGIDVVALQNQIKAAESGSADKTGELIAAMSAVLNPGSSEQEAEELTIADVADAVIELAQERTELSERVVALTKKADEDAQKSAEREVDDLIREGRVLPKSRASMIKLSRSDRETFDALVPDSPIVALTEEGVTSFDEPKREEYEANVNRLVELARSQMKTPGRKTK